MTHDDDLGNAVTGDPAALPNINSFIRGLLSYRPEMVEILEAKKKREQQQAMARDVEEAKEEMPAVE